MVRGGPIICSSGTNSLGDDLVVARFRYQDKGSILQHHNNQYRKSNVFRTYARFVILYAGIQVILRCAGWKS